MIRVRRLTFAATALLIASLSGGTRAAADSGAPSRPDQESYLLHCSGCHGADGHGVPGFAPDLRKIAPFLETQAGRAYLGRVPGVAQAPLADDELASLLNWVLTELAGAPPQPPYSPLEIKKLRAEPLRDPLAARRAVLSAEP